MCHLNSERPSRNWQECLSWRESFDSFLPSSGSERHANEKEAACSRHCCSCLLAGIWLARQCQRGKRSPAWGGQHARKDQPGVGGQEWLGSTMGWRQGSLGAPMVPPQPLDSRSGGKSPQSPPPPPGCRSARPSAPGSPPGCIRAAKSSDSSTVNCLQWRWFCSTYPATRRNVHRRRVYPLTSTRPWAGRRGAWPVGEGLSCTRRRGRPRAHGKMSLAPKSPKNFCPKFLLKIGAAKKYGKVWQGGG